MANVDYSELLPLLNGTGLIKTNPNLYKHLVGLITAGKLTVTRFNADIAAIYQAMKDTFIYGTDAERQTYKPVLQIGNLVLFYATDTGVLWIFDPSRNDWFPVGAPIDATYLTWTDESARLPNSRWEKAGNGISFDDSVPNVRTVNSTGGKGMVPMTTGETPPNCIMFIGLNVMMIPYAGDV